MSLHLNVNLILVLLIVTVSAFLPSPRNVNMTAVDLDFMLRWDWNYTQLENPVTFTVEYTFWNDRDDEGSYKKACEGSSECWCDFTRCKLPFIGSFLIRVRVEEGFQHSNWTKIKFEPDEEVLLAPPSHVSVKADVDMLTLTISTSVMSGLMKLKYRVQYWERLTPEQKHLEDYISPHAPLRSLKSGTEYCLQVSYYSDEHDKSSNYTPAQCVYTTGHSLVWLMILAVLGMISLIGALLYSCHKFRRKSTACPTPESITGFPTVPLFIEAQEECFTIAQVITPDIKPIYRLDEEQEQEHPPELQVLESTCQRRQGSVQDSGFSSGLES